MPVAIVGAGMIVAIRPVAPVRAADAGGADPRGSLLHTLGVADADTADDWPVEFIVREDGGETVSVMQVNTENLLAGERVLLTASDRTRLSHGALPLPAGG